MRKTYDKISGSINDCNTEYPIESFNKIFGSTTDQVLGRVSFGWMLDMRDMMRGED